MQKTNKLGLFALILISFFCLSIEAKDDDYMIKLLKETAHRCERFKSKADKADTLEKENNELKAKVGRITELEKRIEEEEKEIKQLRAVAGTADKANKELEAEKLKVEEEKKKIEELEKKGMAEDKTEPTYKSTVSPFMLFLQVLTLLCSICAIVLLIKNSLTIKDFSETHWRD